MPWPMSTLVQLASLSEQAVTESRLKQAGSPTVELLGPLRPPASGPAQQRAAFAQRRAQETSTPEGPCLMLDKDAPRTLNSLSRQRSPEPQNLEPTARNLQKPRYFCKKCWQSSHASRTCSGVEEGCLGWSGSWNSNLQAPFRWL